MFVSPRQMQKALRRGLNVPDAGSTVQSTVVANMGTYSLGNGVISGTVTGFSTTPSNVVACMMKPINGQNIFVVITSLTSDGFTFELSSVTDSTAYAVSYLWA